MALEYRTVEITKFGQTHDVRALVIGENRMITDEVFSGKLGSTGVKTYPAGLMLWADSGQGHSERDIVTDETGKRWFVSMNWAHRNKQGRIVGWNAQVDWTADKSVW